MLEWTKRKLQTKSQAFNSLVDAYDDLLVEYKDTANYHPSASSEPTSSEPGEPTSSEPAETEKTAISPEAMETELRQLLEVLQLHDIELTLQPATPKTWDEMNFCYSEYSRVRTEFLKLLGQHCSDECLDAGLKPAEIEGLVQGLVPENFNTHLKIPFDFGGMANVNNLALVQTHPTHGNLHKIIDIQIENHFLKTHRQIFIPYFKGRIYHG